jgi:hypothetical protein
MGSQVAGSRQTEPSGPGDSRHRMRAQAGATALPGKSRQALLPPSWHSPALCLGGAGAQPPCIMSGGRMVGQCAPPQDVVGCSVSRVQAPACMHVAAQRWRCRGTCCAGVGGCAGRCCVKQRVSWPWVCLLLRDGCVRGSRWTAWPTCHNCVPRICQGPHGTHGTRHTRPHGRQTRHCRFTSVVHRSGCWKPVS